MIISVVIPTHNRPELLAEAVRSVREQAFTHWELVVVDDGSTPPVSAGELERIAGREISLHRHDTAKGVVAAKNAGIAAAHGDVVLFLDDDDLLTRDALSAVASAFEANPGLDCVFMNVEPFGKRATGASRNQDEAMSRLFSRAGANPMGDLVFFDEHLVDALLRSVPLAMQRPAARTAFAREIGPMPESLVFAEPEWTILAAMLGRVALTRNAVSKWRVDGQNFASKPEMAMARIQRTLAARQWLLREVSHVHADLSPYVPRVRRALATAYRNASFCAANRCRAIRAMKYGVHSFRLGRSLSDVKRILLGVPYRLLQGCAPSRRQAER